VSRVLGLFHPLRAENKGNKVRTGDTAVVKYSAKTEGARTAKSESSSLKEEPVGLHMAVLMPRPIPAQRVRVAPARQLLLRLKQVHDRLQLVQVFALLLDAPQISFKNSCREKIEGHQSCSRSSRSVSRARVAEDGPNGDRRDGSSWKSRAPSGTLCIVACLTRMIAVDTLHHVTHTPPRSNSSNQSLEQKPPEMSRLSPVSSPVSRFPTRSTFPATRQQADGRRAPF